MPPTGVRRARDAPPRSCVLFSLRYVSVSSPNDRFLDLDVRLRCFQLLADLHIDGAGVVSDVVQQPQSLLELRERRASEVERHQAGARITGFTVEEQVSGTEVIVGMSKDPDFGAMLMVGMGGVFVEVYQDVAFRLAPLERRDALDMIGEIRARPLLDGARGRPVLDRGELAELLLRVSDLVEAVPEIEEVDLDPLGITPDGLVAIDARVVVG